MQCPVLQCNPARTPAKIIKPDPFWVYCSLARSLQFLTFTRPDITFIVQQICLYMHDPRETHFHALKHILRYVRGSLDHGVQLHASPSSDLQIGAGPQSPDGPPPIFAYFLGITSSLRHLKDKESSSGHMQSPNIMAWPRLLPRHVGYKISFASFDAHR